MSWSHQAGLGAALLVTTVALCGCVTATDTPPTSTQTTTYVVPQGANVIYAPSAPPAPRVEVAPAPTTTTVGMVWQQGSWAYQNGNWVWVPGQYVAWPQGYSVWQPGRWVQQPNGQYMWSPGHWG